MKKAAPLKWIVGSAAILILFVFGMVQYYKSHTTQTGFRTGEIIRGNLQETVTATGTLQAVTQVNVGSQISGTIQNIYVDFNTKVKKGQLIAQIDPRNYQSAVIQAQATLATAQAEEKTAKAALESAKADLAQAQASALSSQAEANKAKAQMENYLRNLNRYKQLREKDLVSQSELDSAQTDYESYKATYDAALAQVSSVKAQIDAAKSKVRSAEIAIISAKATISHAQAALDQAKLNLSYTRIIAPVDGTIISKEVEVGQTVAASLSAPTLFVIAEDLTKMEVIASIDEADVGKISEAQKTSFTVDAYSDKEFKGLVKQVRFEPVTTSNVVTYQGVIEVDNPHLELRPGMTANITFIVDERENALKVPNSALRFRMESDTTKNTTATRSVNTDSTRKKNGKKESQIYILQNNGQPVPVKITTGITDGSYTEIVTGAVKEGDKAILGYTTATSSSRSSRSSSNPLSGRMGPPR
jgi:HlyD family secretion protein